MFSRFNKKDSGKDGKEACQDLLNRISRALDQARRESSFPTLNEARRLVAELQTTVKTKIKGKDDQDLWASQIAVIETEIDEVSMALVDGGQPSAKEEEPQAPAMTPAGGGGMGLFDGLQVGGGPASDGMGGGGGDALSSGLFAGLTIASSASPSVGAGDEETESLTPASIMQSPMESLASDATATPISLPPETDLSPLPSLDDSKDAPAAQPSSGRGRRKKNLRVGYARKASGGKPVASTASAAPSPASTNVSERAPLSEEFITTTTTTPPFTVDAPKTEETEEKTKMAAAPAQAEETEELDLVGDPVAVVDESESPSHEAQPAAEEEAEEMLQESPEPAENTKTPPLVSLGDLVDQEDACAPPIASLEEAKAAEEEETFSLDFADVTFEKEGSYAETTSKLDKVLSANFIKLDLQNSRILTLGKAAKERRFASVGKIADAKKEAERLEEEQMKAVEDEEYERADELNSSIEEAKAAYEEAIREWYRSQEECEDVAAQFADLTESKSEVKMRFAEALKALGEALVAKAGGIDEKIEALERENAEHEANMAEILEDDMSRLSALRRVLEEREGEVKQKITEKTTEFVAQKEEKAEVKAALEKELEEIRETLRKKEEEMAAVQGGIDEVDAKISKVEAKFAKQLDKLNTERQDIEEEEKKFTDLQVNLKQEQDAIKEKIQEESTRRKDLMADSESASKSSAATEAQMKADMEAAKKTDELRATLGEIRLEEKAASDKTESLRRQVGERKAESARCKEEVDGMLLAVEEARGVIKGAEERLPKLEEEKKAAVAKKNFKDAAKHSAEAKALADDKAQAESTIVDLEASAEEAKGKMAEVEQVVETLESDLAVAEGEGRSLQNRHLAITIDMLTRSMEAAAAEENFDEAAALQNEIEVAKELKEGIEVSLEP